MSWTPDGHVVGSATKVCGCLKCAVGTKEWQQSSADNHKGIYYTFHTIMPASWITMNRTCRWAHDKSRKSEPPWQDIKRTCSPPCWTPPNVHVYSHVYSHANSGAFEHSNSSIPVYCSEAFHKMVPWNVRTLSDPSNPAVRQRQQRNTHAISYHAATTPTVDGA